MRIAAADSNIAPSDNEWGIPTLDLALQPLAVPAPLVAWGSVARGTQHGGTWHFYTDDFRFSSSRLVEQIMRSAPAAVVEPNYSVFDWTPRAEVLASVYRKRRVSWLLQLAGLPVFVDVCMPECHMDLALLGVPKGWGAYATRAWDSRPYDVAVEYAAARAHAGRDPLFLVYGGGRKVREVLAGLPPVVHMHDHMTARRPHVEGNG